MAERFDIWAPKFRNRLGRFISVSEDILYWASFVGEMKAKMYAPVRTGELRASIKGTTRATSTGKRINGPRIYLSAPAKYAPIEFGSRRGHRAQRFLERGMEDAVHWIRVELSRNIPDLLIKGRVSHRGGRFSGRRLG